MGVSEVRIQEWAALLHCPWSQHEIMRMFLPSQAPQRSMQSWGNGPQRAPSDFEALAFPRLPRLARRLAAELAPELRQLGLTEVGKAHSALLRHGFNGRKRISPLQPFTGK